jgi:DNA-binding CsgD family transcriptional regulator/PAS domain-containing protein
MAEALLALETIDLLYRAALEPALWPEALQSLGRAVGGVGTAMIPITPHNTTGLVVSPELQEANVEYEREWWQHDTRVLRIHSRKLKGGVCCEAELFTDEELKRDPLRQEFLRSHGIGAFAAQLVTPLPDLVIAFSVQRALDAGEFEQRQLDMLGLLGRHAARAQVMSTYLGAARQIEKALGSAVARLNCGAVVIDRASRVLFVNAAAELMMGDGAVIEQGELRAQSRESRASFAALLHSALTSSADGDGLATVALSRPSGRKPLLAQAVPLVSAPSNEAALPVGAAAIVILLDPEDRARHDPVEEFRLLGLTPSEARLAALIGGGYSRAEAAEALGISKSTANDTVKQVYSKLDISRQSELVRLTQRLSVFKPARNGG